MSNERLISYKDLLLLTEDSTPSQVTVGLIYARSHDERVRLVEKAISWVVQEMTKTRQNRLGRSEDDHTADILSMLKSMGFKATHDTQYGGHGDLVVELKDDFLWIGEAKIHTKYDWLLQGFDQLTAVYTTGLPGQDCGGVIIYCEGQDAAAVMSEWEKRLKAARPDVTFDAAMNEALGRRTQHKHAVSGTQFTVRHWIIPLYFIPAGKVKSL